MTLKRVIDVTCWYQWKRGGEIGSDIGKGHPQGRSCWFQAPPHLSGWGWSFLLKWRGIYQKKTCHFLQWRVKRSFLRFVFMCASQMFHWQKQTKGKIKAAWCFQNKKKGRNCFQKKKMNSNHFEARFLFFTASFIKLKKRNLGGHYIKTI